MDFEDYPYCEWGDDGPESEDELDRDVKNNPVRRSLPRSGKCSLNIKCSLKEVLTQVY